MSEARTADALDHAFSKLPADFHKLAVNTIKGLSMDAVEKAKSGHPGMPMGTAEMATVLWSRFLVVDPTTPDWPDRDRFVLSAGHGSMLLYSLLHLSGHGLTLDDLKNFRQWNAPTAGHPEYGHAQGIEVTTGPLGTGFAAGVGMALAERFMAHRYNRDAHNVVDHYTYGIVSDGDLMEGVSAEAASFAGHQQLGKLIYLYDDNQISIDGGTEITFTENVRARFEAYGWHVLAVDGHDGAAIAAALEAARAETARPSMICARTVIGHGAPSVAGTSATHGAPLGAEEVAATKAAMRWPEEPFHVPGMVREGFGHIMSERGDARRAWERRMEAYEAAHPEMCAEFRAQSFGTLPDGIFEGLPSYQDGESVATRKVGAKVLAALSAAHPTLVGGSADLAGSNGVVIKDLQSMQAATPTGRAIHFGVREHGMAGICNGLALHGGLRVYGATFLVFSDFMRGCVRLSALMGLPVTYVFSHDSVWLGEDGPTHQPIEHVMSLRMIPNLHVVRPGDPRETVGAWKHAMTRTDGPTAIIVTRQGLPTLTGSREDISQGAYAVWEAPGEGDLHGIFVSTGSEVSLCVDAAVALAKESIRVRVVSMPCWRAFEDQPQTVRDDVLPPSIQRRLSVEAGTTIGWAKYASAQHGIDRFGASAPGAVVARELGMHVDAVVARFKSLLG